MRDSDLPELRLGAEIVQLLLPHRRPFLMVDRIDGYRPGPQPALMASRMISANESVFEGHFPGLAIWPGVYTIEGLGQACNALLVLDRLREEFLVRGATAELFLESLRNLEHRFRMSAAYRPGQSDQVLDAFRDRGDWPLGMNAAVQVKLVRPVFAGERLTYVVQRTRVHEDMTRCDVEATCEGQVVATGTMTSVRVPQPPRRNP